MLLLHCCSSSAALGMPCAGLNDIACVPACSSHAGVFVGVNALHVSFESG